jgi:hypothetical protein
MSLPQLSEFFTTTCRPVAALPDFRRALTVLTGAVALLLGSSGCAFDIVSVKQLPVVLTQMTTTPRTFSLRESAIVRIGTGFPVNLKANTVWQEMGATEFGDVYTSNDQVLTVEASNIHESALVMRDGQVTGFYLLIEKKFCPAKQPVTLAIITTP